MKLLVTCFIVALIGLSFGFFVKALDARRHAQLVQLEQLQQREHQRELQNAFLRGAVAAADCMMRISSGAIDANQANLEIIQASEKYAAEN